MVSNLNKANKVQLLIATQYLIQKNIFIHLHSLYYLKKLKVNNYQLLKLYRTLHQQIGNCNLVFFNYEPICCLRIIFMCDKLTYIIKQNKIIIIVDN